MDMKTFYDFYNFNQTDFAEIAGVGARSVTKFANGQEVRKTTKERIEKAILVIEKNNFVRPTYDYGRGLRDMFYRSKHFENVRKYKETVKEAIMKES